MVLSADTTWELVRDMVDVPTAESVYELISEVLSDSSAAFFGNEDGDYTGLVPVVDEGGRELPGVVTEAAIAFWTRAKWEEVQPKMQEYILKKQAGVALPLAYIVRGLRDSLVDWSQDDKVIQSQWDSWLTRFQDKEVADQIPGAAGIAARAGARPQAAVEVPAAPAPGGWAAAVLAAEYGGGYGRPAGAVGDRGFMPRPLPVAPRSPSAAFDGIFPPNGDILPNMVRSILHDPSLLGGVTLFQQQSLPVTEAGLKNLLSQAFSGQERDGRVVSLLDWQAALVLSALARAIFFRCTQEVSNGRGQKATATVVLDADAGVFDLSYTGRGGNAMQVRTNIFVVDEFAQELRRQFSPEEQDEWSPEDIAPGTGFLDHHGLAAMFPVDDPLTPEVLGSKISSDACFFSNQFFDTVITDRRAGAGRVQAQPLRTDLSALTASLFLAEDTRTGTTRLAPTLPEQASAIFGALARSITLKTPQRMYGWCNGGVVKAWANASGGVCEISYVGRSGSITKILVDRQCDLPKLEKALEERFGRERPRCANSLALIASPIAGSSAVLPGEKTAAAVWLQNTVQGELNREKLADAVRLGYMGGSVPQRRLYENFETHLKAWIQDHDRVPDAQLERLVRAFFGSPRLPPGKTLTIDSGVDYNIGFHTCSNSVNVGVLHLSAGGDGQTPKSRPDIYDFVEETLVDGF